MPIAASICSKDIMAPAWPVQADPSPGVCKAARTDGIQPLLP